MIAPDPIPENLRQPSLVLPYDFLLRPWAPRDVGGLVAGLADPLVRRYSGFLVEDRPQAQARIEYARDLWRRRDGAEWVIVDEQDRVVGGLSFGPAARHGHCGSVGYWLVARARGLGLVTRAVRAGTRLAYEHCGWHRIELYHAVDNDDSCAVAQRCGYRYEGTMRSARRYPDDGRWSDEHLHARLIGDQP